MATARGGLAESAEIREGRGGLVAERGDRAKEGRRDGVTYIHSMQAALEGGGAAGLGDGALLARLAEGRTRRSAVAFEAIVGRHGPMVLAVCRQVLRDEHEAADAFQATFLVLAQSAQRLRDGDRLGGWLRGVARRVAVRVRSSRRREWADSRVEPWRLDDTAERRELRSLVAAEVARLPAAYRDAVRLCDLDGLPHEEAAARLGVAVGTVGSRVSRGRSILRRRLAGAGRPRRRSGRPASHTQH